MGSGNSGTDYSFLRDEELGSGKSGTDYSFLKDFWNWNKQQDTTEEPHIRTEELGVKIEAEDTAKEVYDTTTEEPDKTSEEQGVEVDKVDKAKEVQPTTEEKQDTTTENTKIPSVTIEEDTAKEVKDTKEE